MKLYNPSRPIWCLALLAMLAVAGAADIRCATCGRTIRGRYIAVEGKAYCSQACHQATLPKCATCNRPISGRYLRQEDRNYCSQTCLDATLPKCSICGKPLRKFAEIKGRVYCHEHAEGPRCDACGLPMTRGRELPDKRLVCPACSGRIVLDERQARLIYQRAGREVEKLAGLDLGPLPPLELVGREAMPGNWQKLAMVDIQERGFYRREVITDTYKDTASGKVLRTEQQIKETIHILYGLTPEELLCTAGHELTHALQARFLPRVHDCGPLWLKEGICQYLAAAIARRHGHADELAAIERSPHPAYGRGYRFLKRRFGEDNWPGLFAWLKTLDPSTLPAELPEDLPGGAQ